MKARVVREQGWLVECVMCGASGIKAIGEYNREGNISWHTCPCCGESALALTTVPGRNHCLVTFEVPA